MAEPTPTEAPPYRPQDQALGGIPSPLPDIPVCAVFLALFIGAGAAHMFILKMNQHRGKKFVMNGMIFGFCFTRIIATTFRIIWARYPTSVRLGIAAEVAVYAGIILLFIANLFFTQRIVRAQHPHFGWSTPFSLALPILLAIIIGSILCIIIAVIYSFYTLDPVTLQRIRDIQLYAETLYAVVSFLPIPVLAISTLMRRHPAIRNRRTVDKFGSGSMRAKVAIIFATAVPLCLGASWRAGTLWLYPTPDSAALPWYFSKACFYIFNFTIEIGVVLFWIAVRIDKRYFIPNGAKGPFSYGGGFTFAGEPGNEKIALGNRESMRHLTGSRASSLGRVSWGGSRTSLAHESRVSWGGISREDVHDGLGEDGMHVTPYPAFEQEMMENHSIHTHHSVSAADVGVEGVGAQMGWDPKSGKWALRSISRPESAMTTFRPQSVKSNF